MTQALKALAQLQTAILDQCLALLCIKGPTSLHIRHQLNSRVHGRSMTTNFVIKMHDCQSSTGLGAACISYANSLAQTMPSHRSMHHNPPGFHSKHNTGMESIAGTVTRGICRGCQPCMAPCDCGRGSASGSKAPCGCDCGSGSGSMVSPGCECGSCCGLLSPVAKVSETTPFSRASTMAPVLGDGVKSAPCLASCCCSSLCTPQHTHMTIT